MHKEQPGLQLKGTVPVPVGKNKAGLQSSQRRQRTRMFPRKETREGDQNGPCCYEAVI
jgi:hypothetical protein